MRGTISCYDLIMGDPVELPIDGVLDLHTFAPKDVKDLVAEYLDACAARGLDDVRIIHGKGTGTLRRIVHGVLSDHPLVVAFRLAGDGEGGWGATLVQLRPPRRS
jgi:DNA-nicking Smr family endonuclease